MATPASSRSGRLALQLGCLRNAGPAGRRATAPKAEIFSKRAKLGDQGDGVSREQGETRPIDGRN
ncbi:hypothetical protein BU26DRAFT_518421 [Trematosphaeria pertusa]|uniref:Uncharacterized protein n=1 Tax=Trematosphaeria pertusa TaxID=390896 RepID=A0A6A6IK98_9PLEO|nr:uncharacterized protein BU26DRAFT_518421 [Trematosphaeria pertusa]KAF2249913.1 hypothetical protein BU26DRAFT_518421 [Trematosphaeria pertusa]